jgi:nucleotide-binding universal stress UspA family protein
MFRIVVGVDGSPGSDAALRWAVRESQLRTTELDLLHGYLVEVHWAGVVNASRDVAERTMAEIIDRNRALLDSVKWSSAVVPVLSSSVAHALVHAGDDADLIVVGSRGGGGFGSLLLGSTSLRTADHATCPVVVVRGEAEPIGPAAPIVVGVDGSRASQRALRWALDEAALRGGAVVVVHGYEIPDPVIASGILSDEQREHVSTSEHEEAVREVDRTLAQVEVPADVRIERIIEPGSAAALVLARAGSGLAVVGTRGRGTLGRMLLGSVSHQVLHHAVGPVAVVP